MGEHFAKFVVCSHHHWNPFSEEVNKIPAYYWVTEYKLIQMKVKDDWEYLFKPNAELAALIIKPQIFKVYKEEERRRKKVDSMQAGKEVVTDTKDLYRVSAEANAYYDPNKGLVGIDGQVIIGKEQYENMMGISGVAVSY